MCLKFLKICKYSCIVNSMYIFLSFFFLCRVNKMSESVIRSKQAQREVNGIPTEVVCTEFSNYIFVVLTQYGKIGTLISVTPDSRSNDLTTPTFSTKVLLGKDEVHWLKLFTQISCQCDANLFTGHQADLLQHRVSHFMPLKGKWDWFWTAQADCGEIRCVQAWSSVVC